VSDDNSDDIHHTRYKFEALEDFGSPKAADLRFRIEEMMRIKLSVSNELRDLENKRQKLQGEISLHSQKIEELKADVLRQQQELEKLKLSVEQAKYAQQEAIEKNMPELAAPKRIFASEEDHVTLSMPSNTLSSSCRFHLCIDYSRCSFTSGFPVYFYNPEEHRVSQSVINSFVLDSISRAINSNPHVTYDPHIACVFIVLIGESESQRNKTSIERHLRELPYWYGDGRNHVLLNLGRNPTVKNILRHVNTGRALIAQTVYLASEFRPGFDIVVPPLLGKSHGPSWENLPLYAPARRKFLLSFQGEHRGRSSNLTNLNRTTSTLSTVYNMTNYSEFDSVIVECLKKMQSSNTDDNFFFQFVCSNGKIEGEKSEWDVCETRAEREKILEESTFSLIISPTNLSLYSTFLTQMRLFDSLKNGAIPIVLGDHIQLPFADLIDWNKACLMLPKARVTELHFLIRTIVDNDLYGMRHQGRLLWEKYFSTSENILNTILSFVRSRLKLTPLPIKEEASPSVFNATFQPLKMEGIIADAEAEESVGPLEAPYPSPKFRRNLTITINENYETWNKLVDPFRLYPYMPFDPVLPSEAKFLGSGVGFRPIGKGVGGAGKEFSESLGGNVPREQFTVVMLTYEREAVLINSLQHLYGLPHLNKVVVVWNGPHLPPEDLRWPDIGVPVQVVKAKKNSLNNRFLPYDIIETEAILSVDDDAHLRHDEIMFGFRVWREARDRIVGFPGRYHAWDGKFKNWLYNSNYSCELSMVLTGAAFFHKYYAYMYSYIMPQAVRDKVDEYMNCEDIAMNFLVSHITRKPPLKVTSRWTFRCPGCPVALSEDNTHFQERHKCINFFVQVFGYMPLLNTQFRVDSVLFKTRLPHDKQKCFKFI
uniref:glucuronosyl-galactosyl-proteoglycan 4-alpha-N-acetylglucosaminyltransferase n=1 Tax=Strigamia maritima TaxID=126957 RepID=T1J3I4_STRMM